MVSTRSSVVPNMCKKKLMKDEIDVSRVKSRPCENCLEDFSTSRSSKNQLLYNKTKQMVKLSEVLKCKKQRDYSKASFYAIIVS